MFTQRLIPAARLEASWCQSRNRTTTKATNRLNQSFSPFFQNRQSAVASQPKAYSEKVRLYLVVNFEPVLFSLPLSRIQSWTTTDLENSWTLTPPSFVPCRPLSEGSA